MTHNPKSKKPLSLRQGGAGALLGLSALVSAQALAAEVATQEVELETLKIEDQAADANPYLQKGAPYKARVSGDARRTQPLSETPATITVLSETQLEEQGATDLKDVLDNQPGVTVGTGENGNAFGDRYIIRGHEARSDVFVDGLRDPGMTTRETFATEQVELTKGPSSSFAGRGSTGGAVNSITKQASTDYNFNRFDAGVGTDEYFRVTTDSNLRLSDQAAVRLNLLLGDESVPGREYSDRSRLGAALSATYQFNDKTDASLDFYHLNADDTPDLGSYVPRPVQTDSGVRVLEPWHDAPNYAQEGDFLETEVNTVTARVNFKPTDGVTLSNALRYGETTNGYVMTGLRGGAYDPATNTYAPLTLSTHQGNQKVSYLVDQMNALFTLQTGQVEHDFVVGLEYSDLEVLNGTFNVNNTGATNCETPGRGGGLNPSYCITDENRNVNVDNIHNVLGREITGGSIDSSWRVKTPSVYAMNTAHLTPWLSVHGGVRMDHVDYQNDVVNRDGSTTNYAYTETLWNGHAGVGVKPTDEVYAYFNWGTATNINGGESDLGGSCGYGGVCTADGRDAGDGTPERTQSYELGIKADLFDDQLMATASVFQITKSDVFESAGDGYSSGGTLNTGENQVEGVEIGLVGNITDKLSGQVGAAFMSSEITESNDPTQIGRKLSNFADNQATAQLKYALTDRLSFGGTATYKSEMYTGQPDSAASYDSDLGVYAYEVPDYWTFDAFANYKIDEHFTARINLINLTDEDYYTAGYRSGHFLYKGDERRATLTFTGKF